MVNIYLHGKLGILFGKKWRLDVKSAAEAVRAISVNTKGKFLDYLIEAGGEKQYFVKVGNELIEDFQLLDPSKQDIHIYPEIEGHSDWIKSIVGVVLIAVGAYFGQGWLVSFGFSMLLSGVSGLLTPKPKTDEGGVSSSSIGVSESTVRQGAPVPIVYGIMTIDPFPVSLALHHLDQDYDQTKPPPEEKEDYNEYILD